MNDGRTDTPLVLTTQVSTESWETFKARVETENSEGFRAYVRFETASTYLDATAQTLQDAFNSDETALILVADQLTFSDPRAPLLCLDPDGLCEPFRVAVEHLWIVENNVSIGNLLLEEIVEEQVVNGWFVSDDF